MRRRHVYILLIAVLGTVGVVGIVTAIWLPPIEGGWGRSTVEGEHLRYEQFLELAGTDRWGLAGAAGIDFRYDYDDRSHDQFVRAELPRISYALARAVFESNHPVRRVGPDDEAAARFAPEAQLAAAAEAGPPRWWSPPSEADDLSLDGYVLKSRSDGGTASGCLWAFDSRTETLYIWDWVRSEPEPEPEPETEAGSGT